MAHHANEGAADADRDAASSGPARPAGRTQIVALWASVAMAITAASSLAIGVYTGSRNGKAQVELLALSTLQHYLDLAIAHPDLASPEEGAPIDRSYQWFAAQALSTAQSLRTLVGHEADWDQPVRAIIRHHRAYLRSGLFPCADYTPDFVAYLRVRAPDLACAPPPTDWGAPHSGRLGRHPERPLP